jgi:uncharacterized membrane protein
MIVGIELHAPIRGIAILVAEKNAACEPMMKLVLKIDAALIPHAVKNERNHKEGVKRFLASMRDVPIYVKNVGIITTFLSIEIIAGNTKELFL